MNKTKKMQTLATSFLAMLLLLIASPARSAEKLSLMLDWFPNIDHLPIYVARDLGYFEKAGIEVDIITPSETSDGLKLAASGEVDMAISYEPQTIIAAATDIKVTVVGSLVDHPLTTLLFMKGKGIEKPEDLSGKTIGYTVPGLMDVMLQAFANVNNVQNYKAVNVGFTIIPALVAGKVDAVMGPFKTYETVEMAHNGYEAGYFELEKYGIPNYEELIFVAQPEALAAKGAAIKAFNAAVNEAIAFTRKDPQAALQLYLKAVPEADAGTESDALQLTLPYYSSASASDPAEWQQFADFALEHGLIEKAVDTKKLIHTWQ